MQLLEYEIIRPSRMIGKMGQDVLKSWRFFIFDFNKEKRNDMKKISYDKVLKSKIFCIKNEFSWGNEGKV